MGSVLSLFSNVEPVPPQYQVFINFRGDELREGFIGFLEDALKKDNKVNVFIDHDELRGAKLNKFFTKIEESRIALTIFSKRYTESDWCLDELDKITECVEQGTLLMIPIFFNVTTDEVRRLMGTFGDNFRDLVYRFRGYPEKKKKWKKALRAVPDNLGLCYSNFRQQRYLVSSIVEEVNRLLKDMARREEEEAEAKRNYMAARTEEVTKCVVRYLSITFFLVLALGPYLIGVICIFAFFLGHLGIIRAVERER